MNDKILEGLVKLLTYKKWVKDQRLNLVALKKLLKWTSYDYDEFQSFLLTKWLITSARSSLNSTNTKEKILEVITPYFWDIWESEETILPEVKEIIAETPLSFFDDEVKEEKKLENISDSEPEFESILTPPSTESMLDSLSSDHITDSSSLENWMLWLFWDDLNSTENITEDLSSIQSEESKEIVSIDDTVETIESTEQSIVDENGFLWEDLTEDIVDSSSQSSRKVEESEIVSEPEVKDSISTVEENNQVDEVTESQDDVTKEEDISNLVDEVLAETEEPKVEVERVKEESIVESEESNNQFEPVEVIENQEEVIEVEANNVVEHIDELEEKFDWTKDTFDIPQTDFVSDDNDFLNDLSDTIPVPTTNSESKFKFTPLDFILGWTLGVVWFVISYFFL